MEEQRFINLEWVFNRVYNFFARIFGGGTDVDTSFEGPRGLFGLFQRGAENSEVIGLAGQIISLIIGVIVPLLILWFTGWYIYYAMGAYYATISFRTVFRLACCYY
jgi:hypothetical protein